MTKIFIKTRDVPMYWPIKAIIFNIGHFQLERCKMWTMHCIYLRKVTRCQKNKTKKKH